MQRPLAVRAQESEESEESEAASPEGEPACGPSLPPDGKAWA